MKLKLVLECQHAQLCVRCLVEGPGAHAAPVLVGGKARVAVLGVPGVEDARIGGAHDVHGETAEVLAVELDVLQAPPMKALVES